MTRRQRLCRRCKSPLGIDDDRCQVCGENNPVVLPWYTPLVGLALLIIMAYFLIDFDEVRKLIENFGTPQ